MNKRKILPALYTDLSFHHPIVCAQTVLVANVWGETSQMDETVSTCRFAQRMMNVTCEVIANVVQDQSAQAKQLQK